MPKRKYFTLLEKNAARSEAARKRLMNDDLLFSQGFPVYKQHYPLENDM